MSKLFTDFKKPSFDEWKSKLISDLKGKPESLIQTENKIEEISYNAYQHEETLNFKTPINPSVEKLNKINNDWINYYTVIVTDEKEANASALKQLMCGANGLRFVFQKTAVNLNVLFDGIGFEFIETRFAINTTDEYKQLLTHFQSNPDLKIVYELDGLTEEINEELLELLKSSACPSLYVDGYSFHETGANAYQEIGFCLSSGHYYLTTLLNAGWSLSDATKVIHFSIGVGANYFIEVAKVQLIQSLWNKIVRSYEIELNASSTPTLFHGMVGFTNKSVKDPYTNLLRQSTEAMSLITAGIHSICVLPYNLNTTKGTSALSERMAINIPIILKEESYLDKVINPLSGSYTIDALQYTLGEKGWKCFQEIEKLDGINTSNGRSFLSNKVKQTAQLRIDLLNEQTTKLIGINQYFNPDTETNEWLDKGNYLGLPFLILEEHAQTVNA